VLCSLQDKLVLVPIILIAGSLEHDHLAVRKPDTKSHNRQVAYKGLTPKSSNPRFIRKPTGNYWP
jgi:hypothetical protein